MRKLTFLLFYLLVSFNYGQAQTGPGGVGSNDGSSNLSLWLDANKITGISSNSNFSGFWWDQSGNNNHAVIEDNAPMYSSNNGGNNMPALTFDASNDESLRVNGNSEILPTSEISVFVVGNYENSSDSWGGMLFAADDDDWNDGWGIAEQNNTGDFNMWVDHYQNGGCEQDVSSNYGVDQIWTLVFNTTDNLTYGYRSENTPCTDPFNGPINYDAGGNDNLLIGKALTPVYMEGDISEIIIYNVAVNDAQRIIISNYLAAKYNISLNNHDIYNEDKNGNYDYDVAGIGQANDGSNHTNAKGTGIVNILNPRGLGNDEFLFWGHDNSSLNLTETSDIPSSVYARFNRVWRVSERNSTNSSNVNVGKIDMRWDLSGLGLSNADDLRLLIDTNNDGVFSDETPISGATDLGGDIYEFEAVPGGGQGIKNNRRFTLATVSSGDDPLPIELGNFTATPNENYTVKLSWQTYSETNNHYFTIERSENGIDWEELSNIAGANNSFNVLSYSELDENPLKGFSYYRLKQTDYDGTFSYSPIVLVNYEPINSIKIYPNPANKSITVSGNEFEVSSIKVINYLGQDVSQCIKFENSGNNKVTLDVTNLNHGIYIIKTKNTANRFYKN